MPLMFTVYYRTDYCKYLIHTFGIRFSYLLAMLTDTALSEQTQKTNFECLFSWATMTSVPKASEDLEDKDIVCHHLNAGRLFCAALT